MKTAGILLVLSGVLVAASPRLLADEISDAPIGELALANAGAAGVGSEENAPDTPLSVGLDEVVKLVKAGVDEGVILAYVESSPVAYRPSAEELIRLRELGVSNAITTALLRRGDELRRRPAQMSQAPRPATQNGNGTSKAVTYPVRLPYPVSTPVVVGFSSYSYPYYYNYPYYYSYPIGYGYGSCYYPRYYSCYPRASYYYGGYPRASFSVSFGGHYGGYHGGYRHCR